MKLQGGLLDFVTREIEVECLPADIPEHIDLDVSELELHQSIRVRDLPPHPKWKAVSDGETMLVHIVLPKAEEAAATTAERPMPPRRRRPSPRWRRRARPTRTTRRTRTRRTRTRNQRYEAARRARQSGPRLPRHPAQRRVHGGGRGGPAAPADVGDGPGAGAGRVRGEVVRRRAGAAGQAADVHEPQRRRGGGRWRATTTWRPSTCWWWWTKWRSRSAACGRERERIGGRPQRPEVDHRRIGHRPSSRACGWEWAVATRGGTSRTTCCRRFETGEKCRARRDHRAGGRCRRDVRRGGHRHR